ncbi:MAG TPA: hypothetical protein VFI40_08505 [Nocardioides sp.]|nr:hypothetical protein [Nocardioides sp.]
MRWQDLVADAPRLAGVGEERLVGPGVVLVGTVRADGSPRISPVEPLLWEGDLWLSMLWRSTKARDLGRDPRVLVHSVVTGRDGSAGEFKIRGVAVSEESRAVQEGYAAEVKECLGWEPDPGHFHLFRVEIDDVTFIRYDEPTGDQYVVRWPLGREFVRRGTTATSLGSPEVRLDLLAPPRGGPDQ